MTTQDEFSAPPRRFTDRSADTRAAILTAARARFAADGYEKTTIRAVAAEAGIDASMVMRYYGNKANLFQASATVALPLTGQITAGPIDLAQLAAALAHAFVERWEKEDNKVERMVLRTAMTHPEAVAQVQQIFDEQIRPSILASLGDDPDAELRAAMIMSQTLGVILSRYLFCLAPIASADPAVLERAIRDVVLLHLTRPM